MGNRLVVAEVGAGVWRLKGNIRNSCGDEKTLRVDSVSVSLWF